jgi:heavy metal sensor kinase
MAGMILNVRARLTLWHVLAMALILAAFAMGIYGHVRESLYTLIDTRLDESLAIISDTVQDDVEELAEIERHTRVLAFRVQEGDWPLYESGGWIVADLNRVGAAPAAGRWIVESPRGGIYHLKEKAVTLGSRQLLIRTAKSGEQIHHDLDRLRITLVGGFPIALLLSVLGGYFLSGRALSPVQHLTNRARAISVDNLSERLAVPNPHDEIGQLTAVLNDTFARLEEAFTRLKRFTQDAAHELRTPLAVLRSVGEVGLQQQRDPKAYRDVIGSMLEEVDRLGHLVDNLLTLARAESGRFSANLRPENLCTLCEDVVECLKVLAEEKQQTLVFAPKHNRYALIDRDTFRLALINIIANAIRYTPARGAIRVSLESDAAGASLIGIRDNGPGIAREHHARLFERFYRVDPSRSHETGGAGLGLAIAQWAVESNGGRIELESEVGQGSHFRIVLPGR